MQSSEMKCVYFVVVICKAYNVKIYADNYSPLHLCLCLDH